MRIALVGIPVLVSLLLVLPACGGPGRNLPATVPATGIVTLDGKSVEGASVNFISDEGNYHATAVTDQTGAFSLRAFEEKEGAVPGSYKVEVNKTVVSTTKDAGTDGEGGAVNISFGLPEKYATITTSGLTYTIPESGTSAIKIELTSK